jgi:hypothetical protein
MEGKSRWVTRTMNCPDAAKTCAVLLEWRSYKGKKLLRSLTCSDPRLTHYSGEECEWHCLERFAEPGRARS